MEENIKLALLLGEHAAFTSKGDLRNVVCPYSKESDEEFAWFVGFRSAILN